MRIKGSPLAASTQAVFLTPMHRSAIVTPFDPPIPVTEGDKTPHHRLV
jgi:hypothetical protein